MAYVTSQGSVKPAQMHSFARVFAVHTYARDHVDEDESAAQYLDLQFNSIAVHVPLYI